MSLQEIYNSGVGENHATGLGAVWAAAVAETNKLRDELGGAVAGVDVIALQADNAAQLIQISQLTGQVAVLEAQITALQTPQPEPQPTVITGTSTAA